MEDEVLPKKPRVVDRRKLIVTSAVAATGSFLTGFGKERLYDPLQSLKKDWARAGVENETFLQENKEALKNVRLGCSLSPEHLAGLKVEDRSPEDVLSFLAELGIVDVRLGLRWNKSVDRQGNVDLSYYKPWIDACLARGMNLCLNVGPIKVFRWPEDHIPPGVLRDLESAGSLLQNGSIVEPDSKLAQEALRYLGEMLPQLRSLVADHSVTIQPENEAFVPFGKHQWVASYQYLYDVIHTVKKYFPDSPLLLNNPVVPIDDSPLPYGSTLEQGRDVVASILRARPDWRNSIISGVDIYPDAPQSRPIPFTGLRADTQFALESARGSNVLRDYVPTMVRNGARTEITELQAEPWGERKKPGNDVQSLRFAILRSLPFIDPHKPTVMRLWGVEHLLAVSRSGNQTKEHRAIFDLARSINHHQVR